LLVGPVFTRELAITPRRARVYTARAAYVLALLLLMSTAWLVLTGTQYVRDVGDLARFGMLLFQILGPLQLVLAVFSSALLAASAVSQEKDRHTLDLLLLTNLSNSELVLGKLMASLLVVWVLLGAALPFFALLTLFGGVSLGQIAGVFAVTAVAALASGSLGSTLALWREKTFQALAMTVLLLVFWLAAWEIVAAGVLGERWLGIASGTWAAACSPWRAILAASRPFVEADPQLGFLGTQVNAFLVVGVLIALALNGVAVAMVRIWNPTREAQTAVREDETWRRQAVPEARPAAEAAAGAAASVAEGRAAEPHPLWSKPLETARGLAAAALPSIGGTRTRQVWDNPVLWREVCTRAYGRKMLLIRLVYWVLFALAAVILYRMLAAGGPMALAGGAAAPVPLFLLFLLFLLSLILVNTQAVASLTSERDSRALDLLLVSDLSPKEFVYGKLGGAFYNAKEMVLLPMALCVCLWASGGLDLESLVYLLVGLAVLCLFVAMLGVHAGMTYVNSRSAVAASLGTVFFLFVGVAACMWMMLAFSGSFQAQWPPFFACMLGGGAGLYLALGVRNPSTAIGLASFLCPVATFYAITCLLVAQPHLAFVAMVAAYGFATLAMLIPAIAEFDLATGRTTLED